MTDDEMLLLHRAKAALNDAHTHMMRAEWAIGAVQIDIDLLIEAGTVRAVSPYPEKENP